MIKWLKNTAKHIYLAVLLFTELFDLFELFKLVLFLRGPLL